MRKFLAGKGDFPQSPCRKNPVLSDLEILTIKGGKWGNLLARKNGDKNIFPDKVQ